MVFELVDLESLGEQALCEFNDAVVSARANDAAHFDQAVDRLMAKVEFAYGVAAKLAQREPTLEGTEAIWAKMVAICDGIARQIQAIEGGNVVRKASYDRLLDYRNAAEGRRELHS